MSKLKYRIFFVSAALFLVIAVTCVYKITDAHKSVGLSSPPPEDLIYPVCIDYEPYKDLNSMVQDAEMIFQGTVLKINGPVKLVEFYIGDDKTRPYYAVYTISDIQVEKVLKGQIRSGDIIQIKQHGGYLDDETWNSQDEILLTEGAKAIFFTDPYKVKEEYPPSILVFRQGIFKIENEIIQPNDLQKSLIADTNLNSILHQLSILASGGLQ